MARPLPQTSNPQQAPPSYWAQQPPTGRAIPGLGHLVPVGQPPQNQTPLSRGLTQASGPSGPHNQLCEKTAPPTASLTLAPGSMSLQPETPGPSFTHQWVGTSPRNPRAPAIHTSRWTLAPGSQQPCSLPCQDPVNTPAGQHEAGDPAHFSCAHKQDNPILEHLDPFSLWPLEPTPLTASRHQLWDP